MHTVKHWLSTSFLLLHVLPLIIHQATPVLILDTHTLPILAQELMSSYFTKPKDWSFNNWCPLICFQGAQSRRNSQIHLLISWSEFCHLWNNISSFKKDHVYYIWLANANISYNYVEYLVWYMIAKGIILLIANIK